MYMIFPPKEHYITKASHGDVASDMAVMWDSKHDVIIKKMYKEFSHEEQGFQVADSEREQGPMHYCKVLQCIPTPSLPGILN